MVDGHFDPYRAWLAIPDGERPPDHYVLLGLPVFEADQGRIKKAFFQRQELVHRYEVGSYEDDAQRLLRELSAAFRCLSCREDKQQYDQRLQEDIRQQATIAEGQAASVTRSDASSPRSVGPRLVCRVAASRSQPSAGMTEGGDSASEIRVSPMARFTTWVLQAWQLERKTAEFAGGAWKDRRLVFLACPACAVAVLLAGWIVGQAVFGSRSRLPEHPPVAVGSGGFVQAPQGEAKLDSAVPPHPESQQDSPVGSVSDLPPTDEATAAGPFQESPLSGPPKPWDGTVGSVTEMPAEGATAILGQTPAGARVQWHGVPLRVLVFPSPLPGVQNAKTLCIQVGSFGPAGIEPAFEAIATVPPGFSRSLASLRSACDGVEMPDEVLVSGEVAAESGISVWSSSGERIPVVRMSKLQRRELPATAVRGREFPPSDLTAGLPPSDVLADLLRTVGQEVTFVAEFKAAARRSLGAGILVQCRVPSLDRHVLVQWPPTVSPADLGRALSSGLPMQVSATVTARFASPLLSSSKGELLVLDGADLRRSGDAATPQASAGAEAPGSPETSSSPGTSGISESSPAIKVISPPHDARPPSRELQPVMLLAGHGEPVSILAWAADGLSLASGGEDSWVTVWTVTENNASPANLTADLAGTRRLAWLWDGDCLAVLSPSNQTRILDARGSLAEPVAAGFFSAVRSGFVIATGTEMLICDRRPPPFVGTSFSVFGEIRRVPSTSIWRREVIIYLPSPVAADCETGAVASVESDAQAPQQLTLVIRKNPVPGQFPAAGDVISRLPLATPAQGLSWRWDPDKRVSRLAARLADSILVWRFQGELGQVDAPSCLAVEAPCLSESPPSNGPAVSDRSSESRWSDVETQRVAWSPCGRYLAVASSSGLLRWAVDVPDECLRFHDDVACVPLAFGPGGSQLATTVGDGSIRLYDTATGAEVTTLASCGPAVVSLAWHPSGVRLAVGYEDGSIGIWECGHEGASAPQASSELRRTRKITNKKGVFLQLEQFARRREWEKLRVALDAVRKLGVNSSDLKVLAQSRQQLARGAEETYGEALRATSAQEKRRLLEQVLRIDPSSDAARRAANLLKQP